jgi:hypothetical protein
VRLFGRQIRIEFGQPGQPGRAHDGLRIAFAVRHTRESIPSPATITVYNLAPQSLGELERPGCVVRLFAGYDVPKLLVEGNIIREGLVIERRGVDRVATIQVQDGGRALTFGRCDLSISRPTTTTEVFQRIIDGLGLPRGSVAFGREVEYTQGFSFYGRAVDALNTVAAAARGRWWVRDGLVFVTPIVMVEAVTDAGVRVLTPQVQPTPESAVVFGVAEGNLIGAPTRRDGSEVEVTALLTPEMRPGRPFVVRGSERSDGVYVAREVEHTGDVFGQEFYTTCRGGPR